jgi:hypothetical protein
MVGFENGAFGASAPVLSLGFRLPGQVGENDATQTAAHAATHAPLDGDLVRHLPFRRDFRNPS